MRQWRGQRRSAPAPVDPVQAQVWHLRHQRLCSELAASPDHEWAWLWRTRVKVLEFLIERQTEQAEPNFKRGGLPETNQPKPPDPSATHPDPTELLIAPESTAPYDTNPIHDAPDPRPYLRDSAGQRSRLARLHDINTSRRAREPKIEPTLPPPLPLHTQMTVRYAREWREVAPPAHPHSLTRDLILLVCGFLPYRLQCCLFSHIDLKTFSLKPGSNPLPQSQWELTYVPVHMSEDAQAVRRHHEREQQAQLEQVLDESAQALSAMDERGYKLLRQVIAFDLGLTELTNEVLDVETIRAILAEHGLDGDENE